MFEWFKKNDSRTKERKPIGPCSPDRTIQIVGDVHGCAGLLRRLLDRLDLDQTVVMVGDYVDRGSESAQTLEFLKAKNEATADRFICLKGNHEAMLLEFLDDPAGRGRRWLEYGGLDAILSYRVAATSAHASSSDLIDLRDRLQEKMGDSMINWIRNLPTSFQSGNLVVTHAGLDPHKPLEGQSDKALLWGRSDFLKVRRRDSAWVAFGHNVFDMPFAEDGRIAVDTGAYHSGRLTAAIARPNGEIEFVQVLDS